MGRKLAAEELQIVLLLFLEEKPGHGYELIGALEENSDGFYAPSPGVIYPALAALHEAGFAEFAAEGKRKLYSIAPAGRAQLETNRERAEGILESLRDIGRKMDRVRAAFDGSEDPDLDAQERFKAYRGLKHALMSKRGCTREEARRIAGILDRAANEILETQT